MATSRPPAAASHNSLRRHEGRFLRLAIRSFPRPLRDPCESVGHPIIPRQLNSYGTCNPTEAGVPDAPPRVSEIERVRAPATKSKVRVRWMGEKGRAGQPRCAQSFSFLPLPRPRAQGGGPGVLCCEGRKISELLSEATGCVGSASVAAPLFSPVGVEDAVVRGGA